jgi:hypothetical protein
VREPDDFNEAFAVMDREPPDAILMVSDSLTVLNRKRVFDYAAAHRLPAIYEYDPLVREGGLMSYGPDLRESFERAASMVRTDGTKWGHALGAEIGALRAAESRSDCPLSAGEAEMPRSSARHPPWRAISQSNCSRSDGDRRQVHKDAYA